MQEQQSKKRPPESSVPGDTTSKLATPANERGNAKRIKEGSKATKRKKRFVL